jgi:hypothetical protein
MPLSYISVNSLPFFFTSFDKKLPKIPVAYNRRASFELFPRYIYHRACILSVRGTRVCIFPIEITYRMRDRNDASSRVGRTGCGILIGGLGSMVPDRRTEVVSLGVKALVAGTLATCMTGAVVSLFV